MPLFLTANVAMVSSTSAMLASSADGRPVSPLKASGASTAEVVTLEIGERRRNTSYYFSSLNAAVDFARSTRKNDSTATLSFTLGAGVYEIQAPILFGPDLSGTPGVGRSQWGADLERRCRIARRVRRSRASCVATYYLLHSCIDISI
jgi:hypothetical protein